MTYPRKASTIAAGTAVFLSGATLMALEVAGFRIIGSSFGSALRETTTVIAVFLIAMSLGYTLGGRIGDRWPRAETLVIVLLAASAGLLVVPVVDNSVTSRISVLGNLSLHAFLATTLLFGLPTFLLAMVSPIAIRLAAPDATRSGEVAGAVSALSTVGSVIGSLATAFVLIDWIGSINRTVALLGAVTAAAALAQLVPSAERRVGSRLTYLFAGAALVLTGSFAAAPLNAARERLTSNNTRTLMERDSPYHNVLVLDRPDHSRDLLIDRTLQSRMYLRDPNGGGLEYVDYAQLARILRPSSKSILLIGLGGGTSAKQFATFYPDTTVDAVEIDPLITTAARSFFSVRPSARLRLYTGDGRVYLTAHPQKYDVISIDAYTRGRYGSTIPPQLVTREFFALAAQHLNDGGIVHFHCYAGRDNPFTRSLYRTLRAVFPAVLVFGETEFFASNTPLQVDVNDMVSRATAVTRRLPKTPDHIATLLEPPPNPVGAPLLTDDFAPVDTLLRHH